jgi:peptide/nickel transport system ATP-binding protein
MTGGDTILRLEEVTKVYQTRGRLWREGKRRVVALDRVSFAVRRGEVFGLVGESGSGKTTAGRLIVGLERPEAGRIVLEDTEVSALRGRDLRRFRRRVQMVFQDPYQSFNPQLTILDSVAEPLATQGLGRGHQRQEMALAALEAVGLPRRLAWRFPHQLSGGQRQRAAIARAMILEPTCLVADEPTSMLDASYSAQIFALLEDLRRRLGTTIVFITHSLAAARYLCDRIAVIYRGRLMELGPAEEVIHRPRHPYTQALLDATPRFGRGEDIPRFDTLLKAERPAVDTTGCTFYRRCARARRTRCARQAPPWQAVALGHHVACHYL